VSNRLPSVIHTAYHGRWYYVRTHTRERLTDLHPTTHYTTRALSTTQYFIPTEMQRTVFPGINIKGCFFSLYSMYLVKRTETWFTDSLQRKRRQPPASSKDCSLTTTSAQHDRGLLVQRTRRHRRHRHQHCNSLLHSLRYWIYRRQPNHYTRGTQNYKPSRRLARQTQETSESSASEHLQHNTVTQT
jgi:hypothetical protein